MDLLPFMSVSNSGTPIQFPDVRLLIQLPGKVPGNATVAGPIVYHQPHVGDPAEFQAPSFELLETPHLRSFREWIRGGRDQPLPLFCFSPCLYHSLSQSAFEINNCNILEEKKKH